MNRKNVAGHACCKMLVRCCLLAFQVTNVLAQTEAFSECALELIENSASDVTVGEIRETCNVTQEAVAPVESGAVSVAPESAIDRRLAMEGATEVVPFVITPHKPNYIIYTYNFKDYQDPRAGLQPGSA